MIKWVVGNDMHRISSAALVAKERNMGFCQLNKKCQAEQWKRMDNV